ncbi:NrfD/PsrC family molybdoenzyme membrane anchor subunit [Robertmurraya massiliosenegalensis]|uniref:NrfD/PsrC family molybdoenzyme membrane anchor subunit n=1 Tax=Robertmurraya massiliosenegalensis TaxID=1287657 RepID=UPI00030FB366|nr:NrfD/PsrC family molybdoenzyme membrane anchor subunit [Robertmurraya massiliosenegalensis]
MSVNAKVNQDLELHQRKKGMLEKIYWILLLLVFAIGVYFIITGYFMEGMSSTNLSNQVPWGGWVAFYIYFIGLSAGSFLLSTLIYGFGMEKFEKIGRSALLTAIVCMMTGILFISLDIGRPDHMMNAVIYWNVTSTMSWEIHFYIVYLILLLTELYFAMRMDLVSLSKMNSLKGNIARILVFKKKEYTESDYRQDKKLMKVLGIIGIPLAILGVHGGTGSIFAVAKAQPYLNSALFPLIFIVSALVSGTALSIAIYVIKCKVKKEGIDRSMVHSLGSMLALFLAIEIIMVWYEFLVGFYGLEHEEIGTIKLMMTSSYSWTFWLLQMGFALVIPLILLLLKKTKESIKWLLASAIIVLIGVVGVRFNMVIPTLIMPKLEGLPFGHYSMNLSEWATTFGLLALCLMIYTIGEKLLPIDELYSRENGVSKHE